MLTPLLCPLCRLRHLQRQFVGKDIHGGPPVVYIGKEVAKGGQPYYMGIFHFIEKPAPRRRLYRHFAFKFRPRPPFDIYAVSDELPLNFDGKLGERHPRAKYVAFVNGFDVYGDQLYITYGAHDLQSRLLQMSVAEMEGLFSGSVAYLRHRSLTMPSLSDKQTRFTDKRAQPGGASGAATRAVSLADRLKP